MKVVDFFQMLFSLSFPRRRESIRASNRAKRGKISLAYICCIPLFLNKIKAWDDIISLSKRIQFIFTAFVFLLTLFLFPSISNASLLLDSLKSKTVNAKSVNGEFTQHKIVKGLSIPLISKGIFSYSEDDKLVWHIKTPIENKYSIAYSQITSKSAVEGVFEGLDAPQDQYQKIITMFLDLFSGNWDVLEKYFDITGESNATGWNATLVPKDEFFKTLFISLQLQGNEHINNMLIDEKNGDKTEIEFSQVNVVPALKSTSMNSQKE